MVGMATVLTWIHRFCRVHGKTGKQLRIDRDQLTRL